MKIKELKAISSYFLSTLPNIIKLQICIHPYALFNGILI